ncbi:MAG: thioredoxin family protein [Candidatus Thorarchaeota archaeon]
MPAMKDVSEDYPSCTDYINEMNPMYRSRWLDEFSRYNLNEYALAGLKETVGKYEIVVLFADWCGDARKAIPALAHIETSLGIKIRALGGMTKPGFRSDRFWAVPPSPIEVEIFDIRSSPTVLIFNKETGEEIGRIKTRPKMTPTMEEEILKVIVDAGS